MAPLPQPGVSLQLQALFPLALGQVQLQPDPLDLALQMQAIRELQAGAASNPDPGCAWTGDLNGVWQLQRDPRFAGLIASLLGHAWTYLEQLGFGRDRLALHLQRCWPVVSELGQVVGRHHHPNAHLSGVYYLNGDGSGRSGCIRLFPPSSLNELVPGLAVGHGGPILGDGAAAARWNAPWFDLAPRAGLLLLFPARLDHMVLENTDANDCRFSISFDLVLTSPPRPESGDLAGEYLAPHPSAWMPVPAEGRCPKD
ncbi:MAG: putative 2OG-Fe(II) oxygenase [Cyanobacteriota bacterium]|nr:putative 2OG-Fe(II) oxygenase [Cyanobacteriota bacterium]